MSKGAKLSIFILILVVLICFGGAGYFYIETQKAQEENQKLNKQLVQAQDREKKNLAENNQLKDQIHKTDEENAKLRGKVKDLEKQRDEIIAKVGEITADLDKAQREKDGVAKERDQLVAKVQDLEKQAAEKEKQMAAKQQEAQQAPAVQKFSEDVNSPISNDQYWASILKDKAGLEVELEGLKLKLSKSLEDLIGARQANEDLNIRLNGLQHDKEMLDQEIRFKTELANNLALELARTKNEKKFMSDQAASLNEQTLELRSDIKRLVSTKGSLEKSMVRLTQDKNTLEKQLGATETLVQNKIDEIWEIKDSLDQTIQTNQKSSASNEIELPPIVVNSQNQAVSFNTGEKNPGFNGKVVSLNEANNFVIVDIGEGTGVRLGDALSVYRDGKYIARLEVIQVRKDISAADIKDQWSKVKVGDIIR